MQKALLMASVIIGAFLFQPAAYSQESGSNPCPFGGDLLDGMCTMAAPLHETFTSRVYIRLQGNDYLVEGSAAKAADAATLLAANVKTRAEQVMGSYVSTTWACRFTYTRVFTVDTYYENNLYWIAPSYLQTVETVKTHPDGWCQEFEPTTYPLQNLSITLIPAGQGYQCPPDGSVGAAFTQGPYVTESGQNLCFYPASTPDNDNECLPGTVGDCDIPAQPDCIIAGNGMEVCKADPNDKCQSTEQNGQTIYFNCEAGCGFVNDQFLCSGLPDSDGEIPDLSKCFKVGNSWACPSDPTTPDDNIQNPEKPLPDMNKGDFKEVQKGIETRLDATNSLLGESNAIGKAIGDGIGDLNAKSLAANGILSAIRTNTGATAGNTKDILDLLKDNLGEGEPLELDNDWRGVFSSGLGITGDETIDDLTKEEITLDKFKSEFQWTGGNSSCPAPRPINILRQTFYIDWEPFCSAFNVIGYLILAAAYFLSIRIAFGGRT